MEKVCKSCLVAKPIIEFYKQKGMKDGRSSKCRTCCNKQYQIYYQKNIEANRLKRRLYSQSHKEEAKKISRAHYLRNKESVLKKNLLWKKNNPDRYKAIIADWVKNNPDKIRLKTKKYWQSDKGKVRISQMNHLRKAKIKNAEGSNTSEEWINLKAQYNFTCPCCLRKEPEIKLTRDHILPLSKGGANYISNIQPLCKSCNSTKHDKHIYYPIPTQDGVV